MRLQSINRFDSRLNMTTLVEPRAISVLKPENEIAVVWTETN